MDGDMTNEQIEYFGKEAAKTYIEEGTDLNNTITKIAEEHALNRYEIDRIVEAANTNTYLSMFSNLDDKYIEFPVADAEKVAEYLQPSSPEDDFSDYDKPPEKDYAEIPIFPVDGAEKTSSVQDEDPFSTDNLRFRQRAKYAEQQLIDKISLAENAFSEETENLYQMVKQAVLTGTRFGHIKAAMEQHSPGIFTEKFSEMAKEKLKEEDRRIDLSDTEEKLGTVNKDNEILQQIDKLATIYGEAIDYNEKLASFGTQMLKRLGSSLAGTTRGAIRFGQKNPGITMFGGAVAATGATGIAYKAGKTKAEYETSAIRTIPERYKKR
jgi:hypothetical protein